MSATGRAARPSGVAAGSAAAVLWWGANALSERLTSGSTIPSALADLVLPSAVPGFTWVTPQPWPVLAPALSALAVGALATWFVRGALGGEAGTGRRDVLTAWFCVVAAAVVTGIAVGLGATIADWPPGRLWFLFDHFPDAARGAALWGVVWGWVPALLAARRRADARAGATRMVPVAVLGVVFTALAAIGQASAQLPAPSGEPSAAPTPSVRATPIPTAAAGAPAPDPNWCSPTQLELSLGGEDGALGHRVITLTATNRTGVSCVLEGYPDLAFGDANASLLAVHAVQGSAFGVQDPGPAPIRLGAGQQAKSVMGWDAQPNDPAHQLHLFAVAPYPGAPRTLLPADVDLVAGADLGYTAWQPASPQQ